MNPFLGIALVLAALGLLIGTVKLAGRSGKLSPEWSRKLVHMGMGFVTLALPWVFSMAWPVFLLCGLAVGSLAAVRWSFDGDGEAFKFTVEAIHAHRQGGDTATGVVIAGIGAKVEPVRQLAYRFHTLCECQGWAEDARVYNEVITGGPASRPLQPKLGPPSVACSSRLRMR